MPPEISSPPSLDAASSLERMASQEAQELVSASAGAVSSTREAEMSSSAAVHVGETGTTACPTLSSSKTPPAHANNAGTTEPTESNMVRKGNQTVAVGDWGYPGYLTQQEWDIFVSCEPVMCHSRAALVLVFPPVGPTFSSSIVLLTYIIHISPIAYTYNTIINDTTATIQNRSGSATARLSINRVLLPGRVRGSLPRSLSVAPGAQIPPVPYPHNGGGRNTTPPRAR